MVKSIISILFLIFSFPVFADSLIGDWVHCEIGEDGIDTERYLLFGKNNVELEVNFLIKADSKERKPCYGKNLVMVGSFWHYEEQNSQFTTTVLSHYLILNDATAIPNYNKLKLCGVSSWKINKKVDCSDDKYLRSDLGERGSKTSHDFILKGNELHVIEDGETLIFHRFKGENP